MMMPLGQSKACHLFVLQVRRMGEFKVHRVRFFDYMPSAIRAMAFNRSTERLALVRTDGAVEIFCFADNYFQEKVRAPGGPDIFKNSLVTLYFTVMQMSLLLGYNLGNFFFIYIKKNPQIS